MVGCVYIITNTANGSVYIGKTIKGLAHRMAQHVNAARRGEGLAFYRALRKYGEGSFIAEELFISDDDAALLEAERAIIADYKLLNVRLYNSTHGGEGTLGRVLSDETKERIRSKAIGRKLTAEHRAKIGVGGRGQTRPLEWRQAMSEKRREYWNNRRAQGLGGHPHVMTDEGRRILSENARRRWAERKQTGAKAIGK